jgi:NAD-dependent deacetylase
MTLNDAARAIADAITNTEGLILVLTGAGVSLASGIPTFRGSDEGAVWTANVTEMATVAFFKRNPVGSWQWYCQRFAKASAVKPNPAHTALAALERWQVDRGRPFLLVTQNVDTLHEQAGSVRLVKVHGSADRVRCSNDRCPDSSTKTLARADLDFDRFERDPRAENIPQCAACGSLMRPHVLWFDELYTSHTDYQWPRVVQACGQMRLVVAVGTSFSVGVTEMVEMSAHQSGVPLFVVDPSDSRSSHHPQTVHVRAPAEALLPEVCAAIT